MQRPAIPANEVERLAALHALRILDTPPEERYDRITRLAQKLLDVPVALISLVDQDRQWFKSRQGCAGTESGRDTSFCGHAILGDGPFVVPDASLDDRFHDNPSVTGAESVRFYAGYPLSAVDGSHIGTLCVIDSKAREIDEERLQILGDLAALVEDELTLVEIGELHREAEARKQVEGQLTEAQNRLQVIFDGVAAGIALLDSRRRVIESNAAFSTMLRYSAEDLLGMQLSEFNAGPSDMHESEQLGELIAGRIDRFQVAKSVQRADDSVFDADITLSLVRNALGEPHHIIAILQEARPN